MLPLPCWVSVVWRNIKTLGSDKIGFESQLVFCKVTFVCIYSKPLYLSLFTLNNRGVTHPHFSPFVWKYRCKCLTVLSMAKSTFGCLTFVCFQTRSLLFTCSVSLPAVGDGVRIKEKHASLGYQDWLGQMLRDGGAPHCSQIISLVLSL